MKKELENKLKKEDRENIEESFEKEKQEEKE